jgi:hypothetical protein
LKIVAFLYPGGPAAKEVPELLGCAENGLGLRPFLESKEHEFLSLTDKEGDLDHISRIGFSFPALNYWWTNSARDLGFHPTYKYGIRVISQFFGRRRWHFQCELLQYLRLQLNRAP